MSCFSHFRVFSFWVVVVVEEGGHGFLPTFVGIYYEGGEEQKKNTPNNRGGGAGLPKIAREKIENPHSPPPPSVHKL